jgi:hypothetical protein
MNNLAKPRDKMLHLTTLPPEILHNIFQWLGLQDLGHLPRTCWQLHGFIDSNKALFREVYLLNLVSGLIIYGLSASGRIGLD